MLQQQSCSGRKGASLTAYISESKDREGNLFYIAAICDDEKDELLEELSGYSRDALEKDVHQQYPDIAIEQG
jgi:hypothetical protein